MGIPGCGPMGMSQTGPPELQVNWSHPLLPTRGSSTGGSCKQKGKSRARDVSFQRCPQVGVGSPTWNLSLEQRLFGPKIACFRLAAL